MFTIHDLIQGSQEWIDFRKDKISGTDIAVIMGISDYKSAYQLWKEKLGIVDPEPENAAMKRGKELEPIALKKYCEITERLMYPVTVSNLNSPWAIASLDGLSSDGDRLLEIKCMGARNHAEAMNGNVKPLYNAQMQWQMYVTGLNSCDYFVYSPESHRIITVQRDNALISEMVQKGEEFLEMLRTLTAPPLCDKDYIDRSEDLYLEELLKGYKSSSKLAKQYKSLEDDYKKKIIQYCQEQSTKCGNYRVTRYLQRGRVEYDKIPELQSVDLEIYRKPLITCYQIS